MIDYSDIWGEGIVLISIVVVVCLFVQFCLQLVLSLNRKRATRSQRDSSTEVKEA